MEATMEPEEFPTWNLFVDGSSGETGSGAGVVLESPEGHKLNCVVRFSFKASNNAAEYKALLAGLRLAKEMSVKRLLASSDSQLVVSQVNGKFAAKDSEIRLIQASCLKNIHIDALSKLASSRDSELLKIVPIEHLPKPSISGGEEILWIEGTPLWMQPIIAYLNDQSLPPSKNEAKKLRRRAAHFILQDGVLYKRGFSSTLLQCVGGKEALYILREIHEGVYGNHSGGAALAHMVPRQGYFWPTLKRDSCQFVQKCDEYQRFANIQRQRSQKLSVVTSRWPFSKWDIDFIGPLPKGRGSATFVVVSIDYFTKWIEAEPLAKITKFDNKKMPDLCEKLSIKKDFSTPHHPQANGKLDASKGVWVDKLPHVLWAIRTTSRTAIGETHFSMTYEAKAMSLMEVEILSHRRIHFNEIGNDETRVYELNLLEEMRDSSQIKLVKYQRQLTHYYNSKVRNQTLRLENLVLRRVFQSSKPTGFRVFGSTWEGPYHIHKESRPVYCNIHILLSVEIALVKDTFCWLLLASDA
ncbi:uncharacterized protein LOC111369272 [Olea europaea var. sylvestris]|uniref:uncharacterized protein LOC111369272 n=1 Tax=Olea europaea var. sylvestris TaxID=158386 RepID=UPI000C1CCFE4|nr:uncharacterized protein LOC111369272 [Olea europaea var. sylvestris]